MRFREILMTAATQGGGWSPRALGSSLLAWWDARRTDLVTAPGGLVESWKDIVAGYDLTQATGAARPTLADGYVIPDGVDDTLDLAPVPAGIPTGANGCILWWGGNQNVLPATTASMALFAYGSTGVFTRQLIRQVSSGSNRAYVGVGNGSGSITAPNTADFSGKRCVAGIIDGTAIVTEVDGVASSPEACVPATTSTRIRAFTTSTGTTPSSIPTRHLAVTRADLTSGQKALMTAYILGSL
tara:strand:- start:5307 stop:6032 length:726 start_codon:yes stop_codon:yes gene_type:complete